MLVIRHTRAGYSRSEFPRVAAFPARYLYSPQTQDGLGDRAWQNAAPRPSSVPYLLTPQTQDRLIFDE
jgi:hypothetical protein